MAKKSVDEQSTAEYRFFYQLDWPPERVPPLIELVYFFAIQAVAAASLATPKNSAAFSSAMSSSILKSV
jgi:hypothetical protein